MRGASVVRRRSVTNPGDTAGSVNGGQADGGGSGLLTGGNADGSAAARPDGVAKDSKGAATQSVTGPAAQAGDAHLAAAPSALPAIPARTGGTSGTSPAPSPRRQGSRFALSNWRVRWRLTAVIAVPTLIAAALGSFLIYGDVNTWVAAGRVQHLAHLNTSVVKLSQALEDERDLSAGYAADRSGNAVLLGQLKTAQNAANTAAKSVRAEAAGIGGGYAATTVLDVNAILNSLSDLPYLRQMTTASQATAETVWTTYTTNVLQPANTFSASWGDGASTDAQLTGDVAALGALVRAENQMSLQRGILFAALSSPSATMSSEDLNDLQQAYQQQSADLSDFDAATDEAQQQNFGNAVSGAAVDKADFQETLAETQTENSPGLPLTRNANLTAGSWYSNMSAEIGDTRGFVNQLVGATVSRADTLRSQATRNLLVTALVTVLLLLLVVFLSTIVARSLILPLRKLRTDALDVAGHRLPEMVRRLSQSEGTDESVEIEPIGVTSTDEIGEVARAFDQVHREAVRLAADEAMLRGNLNAMFINLSRRSQSLIERQLSLIDSLEQSEQDPGRLSSLFRLDHLATRMRRNSENLLVLAGHEVTRRWSQPVPLVDVLRAAISEIEQYERVVLNVQPGIVVVGQAVNDVVHLVAEIVENATTFSPEDTQVYVSGQPLSSGGVLLDITDNGVGISDQEMSHANWRLDNPPVVDVAVSRRMGLFVVGRLAARHGVRVRLRHAQAGGLTALIWLPDTVAAPEVAPPLGRLRRFEADDYGPAPSLSAPAQGSSAQATAAARIPRFSPNSPPSPSFSPAASTAGNGDQTPALPVRGTNGKGGGPSIPAVPGNGPAGDGADVTIPRAPAASAGAGSPGGPGGPGGPSNPGGPAGSGPSRLPAFGGRAPQVPKIGGQNVHGGDGPGSGQLSGGQLSGGQLGAGEPPAAVGGAKADAVDLRTPKDPGTDPAKVTIPPPAAVDQRLPIFDSLESDWFRRSGKTVNAARNQGVQGTQGARGGQGSQAGQAGQGAQPAAQSSWTSPADEGWRAAQALAAPSAGDTTQAGLPRRVPRANLVPGSVGGGGDAEAESPARSPDAARTRMASFQRGVREGRAAAPQIEEP
jgi:signal transduction histidine kinase